MKKKLFWSNLVVDILLGVFFLGCNSNLQIELQQVRSENTVSNVIANLKDAGLLNSLLKESRSAINNLTEEDKNILRFINDTDNVLEEIKNEENGQKEIDVIEALFCGASIDEFAECLAKIDPEQSKAFLDYAEKNNIIDENSSSKEQSTKLCYKLVDNTSRAAYAKNLDWSTIGWYTGFCASTVAGFYLFSYGGIWLKAAGAVAATAGALSMVTQIIKWTSCSDLMSFVNALKNKDGTTATAILNSTTGLKIATISTETVATVTACYFTSAGKAMVASVVKYYNILMSKVLGALPSGVNYVVCGLPLKLI